MIWLEKCTIFGTEIGQLIWENCRGKLPIFFCLRFWISDVVLWQFSKKTVDLSIFRHLDFGQLIWRNSRRKLSIFSLSRFCPWNKIKNKEKYFKFFLYCFKGQNPENRKIDRYHREFWKINSWFFNQPQAIFRQLKFKNPRRKLPIFLLSRFWFSEN